MAAQADINFTIDAEEADRLVLSLKLLDRLAREPCLGAWRGLGLAVQAYQSRAGEVIPLLAALAKDSGRRLMVRLVKGAYWDSEIKRAQVGGRPGYPVFTTKPATDLSYLAAARALIDAHPCLYAQFATHNAHTLAAVRLMAGDVKIEHQRLHGMGETLYAAAGDMFGPLALRTYAPVGAHEDLLPYLVRRLLENGANTSFVHLLFDDETPPELVAADPIAQVEAQPSPHPRIPLPREMYGDRLNSLGADLSIAAERMRLAQTKDPSIAVADAKDADIAKAFAQAKAAQPGWDGLGGAGRAKILRAMADALESLRISAAIMRFWRNANLRRPNRSGVPQARPMCWSCTGEGSSPASRPGIFRSPSSRARSRRRWRPVMACWPSPRSRRPASPPPRSSCSGRRACRRTCCIFCPVPARRWARR